GPGVVPLWVEVAATVFVLVPAVVAVTFTLKVHAAAGARVAPASVTAWPPALAVIVPPPQLPVRPLGVATTRPEGRLSVKPTPVRLTGLAAGFVTVNDRLVGTPRLVEPE